MGLPQTVRFDDDLEKRVKKYLVQNKIKFPQLVRLALEKFISEPQTLTFMPTEKRADPVKPKSVHRGPGRI